MIILRRAYKASAPLPNTRQQRVSMKHPSTRKLGIRYAFLEVNDPVQPHQ